ncbi:hypothetical protein HOY80DRAFT_939592 [Tuber brumale]|nr:hypothetical protein HOY80DRAFT_939592 [Tuber brumale]
MLHDGRLNLFLIVVACMVCDSSSPPSVIVHWAYAEEPPIDKKHAPDDRNWEISNLPVACGLPVNGRAKRIDALVVSLEIGSAQIISRISREQSIMDLSGTEKGLVYYSGVANW